MYQNPPQTNWGYAPQQQQPQQMQFALPVDPHNPMYAPLAISIGRPPFVPQIPAPPGLMHHVPLITSILIAEIQKTYNANALRMFMYNMMAAQGYQNQMFVDLVGMTVDYTELLLMTGQAANEEQAITRAAVELCNWVACRMARDYQALLGMLQPNLVPLVDQGVNALITVAQQIQQMRSGGMQQGYQVQAPYYPGAQQQQQPYGGGYQAVQTQRGMGAGSSGLYTHGATASYNPNMQTQSPAPTGRATGFLGRMQRRREREEAEQGNYPSTQPQYPVEQPERTHSRFERNGRKPYAAHPVSSEPSREEVVRQPVQARTPQGFNQEAIVARFGSQNIDATMQRFDAAEQAALDTTWGAPEVVQQGQTVYGEVPQEFIKPETTKPHVEDGMIFYSADQLAKLGRTWRSTQRQPYHPAWNPRTHRLFYVIDENNIILAALKPKTPEEMNMMEYDKHVIGRVPTTPSRFPKAQSAEVSAPEQIVNHQFLDADVKVTTIEAFTIEPDETIALVNSHVDAVVNGHLTEPGSALRRHVIVAQPLPCDTASVADYYNATIQEIAKCGNFDEATRLLRQLTSPEDLLLQNRINGVLTAELERVLKVNLMIDLKKLDSFMEDATSLDGMLRKGLGDGVANSLKEQEAKLLSRCLEVFGKDDAKDYCEQWAAEDQEGQTEGEAGDKPGLAFLVSNVSFTYMSSYMYELGLALPPTGVAMLSQKASPNLYKLAVDLFDSEVVRRSNFRRHYFITKDGIKFEITRGYLNKESYILALVK